MLYVKLALRNLKRSLRDYAIFVMTMTISVMLIFAFNACAFSTLLNELANHLSELKSVVVVVSIFLVMVISWLVSYITKFIIRSRSREFGMYLLMGMQRKEISRMFLCEQLCMGLLSFVLGCLAGTLLYQLMQLMIVNLYESAQSVQITISGEAFKLTALYFVFLYIIELFRDWRVFRKFSIRELLYADKKNEQLNTSKGRGFLYLLISLLTGGTGFYYLFHFIRDINQTTSLEQFMMACILIAVSIYFLFMCLSLIFRLMLNHLHSLKYQGKNLVLFGFINSRLRSNRFILATLCVLTVLTLTFVCSGLKFKELNDQSVARYAPYSLMYSSTYPMQINPIIDYVSDRGITYSEIAFEMYSDVETDHNFSVDFMDTSRYYPGFKNNYIKESDYQKLRMLKGLDPMPALGNQEYAICANAVLVPKLRDVTQPVMFQGVTMQQAYCNADEVGQSSWFDYYVILPDQYLEGIGVEMHHYFMMTEQPLTAIHGDEIALYDDQIFQEDTENKNVFAMSRVQGSWERDNMTSFIIIVFSLFYCALIFSCITATIIAIQQLSDIQRQQHHYQLLHHLGISKRELKQLLARQIFIYFMIPFVLPLLYTIPILQCIADLFRSEGLMGSMWGYLIVTLCFYLILYGGYYLLTYVTCKRNILDEISK